MDFAQALLEKYRVHHLALGGALGDFVGKQVNGLTDMNGPTNSISGAAKPGGISMGGGMDGGATIGKGNLNFGNLGGKAASGWHDMIHPSSSSSSFTPNMPVNQFTPNMPTNTFQAQAPTIQGTDYAQGLASGMSGYNEGQQKLGAAYDQQMGLANQAGGTIGGLQGLYGQQAHQYGQQLGLAQQAGQTLGAQQGLYNRQLGAADQSGQMLGQQQGLYGQQQGLADALLAQSRGQGPNPAQQMFQQNTNQNIAQQQGAIASARGINPALAARMASQQGAAMNQQAAGQSALLGAQQQLAAQQQLGAQQQSMGQNIMGQNATLANQGNLYGQANQNLLGQNQTFANQGNLYGQAGQTQQGMGQNLLGQNQVYGTEGNILNQASGTAGTMGGLASGMYGTSMQGLGEYNKTSTTGQLGAAGINAGVAAQNASLGSHGEDLKAGVAAQNAELGAEGEKIKSNQSIANAQIAGRGNQGMLGGAMNGIGGLFSSGIMGKALGSLGGSDTGGVGGGVGDVASSGDSFGGSGEAVGGGADTAGDYASYAAHGGVIPDHQAIALAHALMGRGGPVPGKAQVKGDSAKNDTVPTVLSPKEIVVPRSITMAKDAPEKAAEFVAKLKGKEAGGGAKQYGKILEKHRHLKKKMAELDELVRKHA